MTDQLSSPASSAFDGLDPDEQAEMALIIRWAENPTDFVTEALGVTPEGWQVEALNGIRDGDHVAIRSGHGVGKSALMAWITLWWLLTRFPAKVACTAPTAHQLQDVLWGEIAKWYRQLDPWLQGQLEVKSERVERKEGPAESFAVARTARKEQPEAFQGFHSENMLFLVDEASGVEDIIFEVGEGAMSTAGAKTLMAGNPTRPSGYFYDAFHKMRAHWLPIKVGCNESSRVSPAYIEKMATQYGADSNIYRVRVLGEFPTSEDDSVIPLHLCEAAKVRLVKPSEMFRPIWGVDVARFGDDRTSLAKRQSNVQLEPVKSWRGKDTMQTSGLVKKEWDMTDPIDRPSEICIDVIGLGAGVVDRLLEMGLPARGINVAESATVDERYLRLRDELWFMGRQWLVGANVKLCDDDALIAELTGPRYDITSAGKIKVESKDDMKARGLDSPDLADAWLLTFAGAETLYEPDALDRYMPKRRESQGSWMTA